MRLIPLVVLLTLVSGASYAQTCEVTGNVPTELRKPICAVATSVHGGGAPVNQLTVMFRRQLANEVASETLDAKNMLLQLLGAWTRTRGVRVARVEVFYEKVHLATVKTSVFGRPSVTFH